MTEYVNCPRCRALRFNSTKFKHGCLLCDDKKKVSRELAAAYAILVSTNTDTGNPTEFEHTYTILKTDIARIRRDLEE